MKLRSFYKLQAVLLVIGLLVFSGCQGENDKLGGRPRNNSGSNQTATPTPTPTPTDEDDTNNDLKIIDSQVGINKDLQTQGNLSLEIEQGNILDVRKELSEDGTLEITLEGGKSPK